MTDETTGKADRPETAQPTTKHAAPRRRRWWVSLLLSVVLFGSGFVVGGATALIVARHKILEALHNPDGAAARITARLRGVLDLSDDQAAEVEAILHQRQAALSAIRAEVQPRVMAELDLVEQQVAEVLDDAQREKWHKRFAELRETWIPPAP